MIRSIIFTLIFLAAATAAQGHFVFIVPESDGHDAKVVLSEDLKPDEEVGIDIISGAKLVCTDASGHDTTLTLAQGEHAYRVDLPGSGTRIIHGVAEVGVQQRGDSKPFLLTYYPKTIVGDAFDVKTRLSDRAPVELAAVGSAGHMKFLMLAGGKPLPGAEINLILPDGTHQKIIADKDGETSAFSQQGRYGAWARYFQTIAGESGGEKYAEVHQYATLVIDMGTTASSSQYAPLPEAASSFGAVACDGWLYVYGGHTADTHSYSTESVSGRFSRLNLADHKTWEQLPGGPHLQGLNLATYHGKIYRVGGMSPQNKKDETTNIRSVADCACFDPDGKQWTPLPDLPEPRSSHDIAVVGDQLIVVGGWTLAGDADDAHWLDTALVLDLSAAKPRWKAIKQPFERRALIAASYHGKMYVMGGFQTENEPSRRVDIYDPKADAWTKGPDLPGPDENGFGPAACTLGEHLYVSVADGTLYRLNEAGSGWDKVGEATPHIVHRLAPNGSQILVIGGASKQKQLNLIEAVTIDSSAGVK